MADDAAWQPPSEGDTEAGDTVDSATDGAPTDRPAPPTLPAAVPSLPALPPVPPSAWAPGSESTIVSPPLPPSGPTTPQPVTPPSGFDSAATIVAEPLVSDGRRSGWLVGSAIVAVLAVVAAGVFAIVNLRATAAGGSVNPADLGSELLAAIESEDVLGVIDVLAPGERQALGEPFVELISQLQRLDVLAETDLSAIAGLDIELTNEIVRTRTTNVDDIVNVSMSADVVISIDGAELPIGDLLIDNMPDDMLTELRGTRVTQNDEFDISLTAVSVDGRWYFSLLHTIAEAARSDFGEAGIPFQGVGFDGAESPEAAVDQMLDRIEALDLTGIIRSLDPDEAAALQRYAPLFLEDAEAALADAPIDWRITDRSVRVEGSGDERTAFVDALGIEGSIDGSPFSFSFEGECFSAELDGERIEQCADVGSVSDVEDVFGDNPEVLRLIEVVQEAFADVEPVGLELRQRDGEWFVSPIASITDAMLGMLRALDRDELDAIIEAAEPAFASIVDDFFGVGDDFFGSDDFATATTDSPLIAPDITVGVDDDLGWVECYELDAAEATACFRSFEASGVIGAVDIPVVLRHPECGYEASWGGANYQLPDDEFIALAEASRSCFLDLLESGQVDKWELPDEILVLECFEGRNWYQVFDDPEYDLRVDACRSEQLGF